MDSWVGDLERVPWVGELWTGRFLGWVTHTGFMGECLGRFSWVGTWMDFLGG